MMASLSIKERFPLIHVPVAHYDFNDHVATFGVAMSLIHNVFIRAINSLWYNAIRLKKGDEIAFAGYALSFTAIMHHHHQGEEDIVFPFLQTKFDMGTNIQQHEAFLDGLNSFEEYMDKVYNAKETYDGEKVRDLLNSFGPNLVLHLHDEIPTLSPDRLAQYDKESLYAMVAEHDEHIKTNPMATSFTFVITNHDLNSFPNFPPMPRPLLWIIRNVVYWRHSSYWQFSAFYRTGEEQNYATA